MASLTLHHPASLTAASIVPSAFGRYRSWTAPLPAGAGCSPPGIQGLTPNTSSFRCRYRCRRPDTHLRPQTPQVELLHS